MGHWEMADNAALESKWAFKDRTECLMLILRLAQDERVPRLLPLVVSYDSIDPTRRGTKSDLSNHDTWVF